MRKGRNILKDEPRPYLQAKTELDAEEEGKHELEAKNTEYELRSEERHEIEGDGGRAEMAESDREDRSLPARLERHELRGEEFVEEPDGRRVEIWRKNCHINKHIPRNHHGSVECGNVHTYKPRRNWRQHVISTSTVNVFVYLYHLHSAIRVTIVEILLESSSTPTWATDFGSNHHTTVIISFLILKRIHHSSVPTARHTGEPSLRRLKRSRAVLQVNLFLFVCSELVPHGSASSSTSDAGLVATELVWIEVLID